MGITWNMEPKSSEHTSMWCVFALKIMQSKADVADVRWCQNCGVLLSEKLKQGRGVQQIMHLLYKTDHQENMIPSGVIDE